MRALPCILLLACSAGGGADDVSEPPVTPSAWSWEEAVDRGPPLSLSEIEAELPDILNELADFHGGDVVRLYRERMDLREPPCPYMEQNEQSDPETILTEYWNAEGCTTSEGVYFDGYAYSREVLHRTLDDGITYDSYDFKGDGVAIDPDGSRFIVGGFAFAMEGTSRDGREQGWQSGVQGSVTWTGAGYESAWFTGDRLAELVVEAYDRGGRRSFRAEGGVAGFDGSLQGFVAWPVAAFEDSPCPEELGGALWVRDAAGRWYSVVFDGATSLGDDVDMAACDGCGQVSLDGEPLGEVCLSPDALLDWGDSPW